MTKLFEFPQQQSSRILVVVAALFADLIIQAFVPVLIKLSETEIDPNATIFNRFWITTMIFGLWEIFTITGSRLSQNPPVEKSPYTTQIIWLLLGMGIVVSSSQLLWAWSLSQTQIANSAIAYSLAPIFTGLWECLVWGRRFDQRFVIGIVVSIAGACALGIGEFSYDIHHLQGDATALLGSVFYAAYILIVEQLRISLSATTIFLWRSAIGTFLSLPLVLISSEQLFPSSWLSWLFLICLAIASVSQLFIVYSLKYLSSSLVTQILILDPVFTAILGWIIFSEHLSIFQWIVFTVILLGIYLAVSSKFALKIQTE